MIFWARSAAQRIIDEAVYLPRRDREAIIDALQNSVEEDRDKFAQPLLPQLSSWPSVDWRLLLAIAAGIAAPFVVGYLAVVLG